MAKDVLVEAAATAVAREDKINFRHK